MTGISSDLDAARDRLRTQIPAAGYLTKDEAAQLARCSPRTIQRAVHSGALRAYRPGLRVLLREEDVRAWIEAEPADLPDPPPPRPRSRRTQPGSVANLRALEHQAAGRG